MKKLTTTQEVLPQRIVSNIKVFWPFAVLLNLLIASIVFQAVVFHATTKFIGVPGDAQQTMWFMGWFWYAISHGLNPFVADMMNYPHGINMMLNASIVTESIIFGPLSYMVNPAFAYNAMMFVNYLAIGILGTLIFIEFRVRKWLALVGGIFLQIMPYTTAGLMGHANLTFTLWIFVIIYLSICLVKNKYRNATRFGILFGVMLAAQFYTSVEVFATIFFVALLGFLLGVIFLRKSFWRFFMSLPIRIYVSAFVAAAILISPGIVTFFFGPYTSDTMYSTNADKWGNDLLSFMLPSFIFALHGDVTNNISLKFVGSGPQQFAYLGFVALFLIMWAAQSIWKQTSTKIMAVLFLIVSLLSMGPHLLVAGTITKVPLPWYAVTYLPVIEHSLPLRLMFYGDILAITLIVLAFENLLKNGRQRWRVANIVIASTVLIATWFPSPSFPNTATPSTFSSIEPGGKLYDALLNQPTVILSNDFSQVMQALANQHYKFPVSNVYAYDNNTPAELAYRPDFLNEITALPPNTLQHFLSGMLASQPVQRVLFLSSNNDPIPQNIYDALIQICGKPIAENSQSALVWNVPNDLEAVWFGGDIWKPFHLISEGEYSGWAGMDWSVHTRGQGAVVTITGFPKTIIPDGVELNITQSNTTKVIKLNPDDIISLTLGENDHVHVKANSYFIPDNETIHVSSLAKVTITP